MTERPPGEPSELYENEPVGTAPTAEPATEPAAAPRSSVVSPPTSTRTGIAFSTLIAGAIVLIVLLVFILENTQSVEISFFGASFHLPLGVALLLAAIGGALLMGIVGGARILQLRRHVRRRRAG